MMICCTVCIHASKRVRSVQAARMLISHGANVNARDADGQTPLFYAALCEHKQARTAPQRSVLQCSCCAPLQRSPIQGTICAVVLSWPAGSDSRGSVCISTIAYCLLGLCLLETFLKHCFSRVYTQEA